MDLYRSTKPDEDILRKTLLNCLGVLRDPRAVELLLDVALKETNLEERAAALDALGAIKDPSTLPALVKLLDDPNAVVRKYAAFNAGAVAGRTGDASVLEPLRARLKDVAADAPDLPTDGSHACYNVYECADGKWLALGALEGHFWARFCDRIGRPEWAPLQFDASAQPAIIAETRALLRARTRDAWVAEFAQDDICVSPVRDPAEALAASAELLSSSRGALMIKSPF
jgi:HEAT repeat protein